MTATILVIDDNEDDQRLYQRAFKNFDCFFNLVMASSAEVGFARIADAHPDLILLDYNLPDMDGLSFMKRLAEYSDTPIPVVMLTGEGKAELAVGAMKHGADDYLVKDTGGRYLRLLPGVAGRVLAAHTRRKETQWLQQKTETLLLRNQTLMQNSMDGIHVMDKCGNIVEANEAFCRMLGYTREEMARLNMADWEAQWSAEELRERFKSLIGNSDRFETVHRRKDGTLINVEISTSSMEIEGLFFVFASSHDITARKRTEQELIFLNNQLTHEVTKRTADLSALTAHIQKIAETEKTSLARELHDEMGSTLTGLSMEVGRLKGKISDPDHLQDLSAIKELVSHASQIIRGVINQLYPTVLDDCDFAAAVEWLVKGFRKNSGIEVELFLPEEQIAMQDTFALAAYRITQECLTNIAKHAGASKVQIKLEARDGLLDLKIHDNGRGFSGRINAGSHGIFGMIERARYLGGSMEIGSEDGKGTTARLSLPLAGAKPKNRNRVLVVDDHAIVRDAIRQLLHNETDNFLVAGEAADGVTAIQMAIGGEWDIVLLDISLPNTNGITVLEEIMAVKPALPVIMLSSYAQVEYADIALSKGASGYIEKGETAKLVEAMRQAMLLH